jgi:hypothetical protein
MFVVAILKFVKQNLSNMLLVNVKRLRDIDSVPFACVTYTREMFRMTELLTRFKKTIDLFQKDYSPHFNKNRSIAHFIDKHVTVSPQIWLEHFFMIYNNI